MSKKITVLGLLMVCLLSATSISFAHDASEHHQQNAKIEIVKITDRVSMLMGNGGNIGVSSGADGVLMIDDQFAASAAQIQEALKTLGSDKPRFLINTHWHGDHTGGNEFFGKFASIIAQSNVRKRLSVGSQAPGRVVPPAPLGALPVITYDSSMSVYFNGEELKVMHYPNGHTDGDSVIFFTGSNIVHMGDHYFKNRFPFVDASSGGTVQGITANVGAIIARLPADVKIIPGHGALSNLDELKTYHQMLIETTDIVQKAMQSGKTLDQIKKAGFPAKYKDWGTGFIKTDAWIETIYKSLSGK